MKLIFGLGNPGKDYVHTRHNVGFDALDSFAIKQTIGFVTKPKLAAEVAEWSLNGEKVLLVKPSTFYNSVGESFQKIDAYYQLEPRDCLIVHDELALPLGSIRIRDGGSDAGNNGIKSINAHHGEDTLRLRVGVANEQRSVIADTNFVLGKFPKNERELFDIKIMPTIHAVFEDFANGVLESTTHQVAE